MKFLNHISFPSVRSLSVLAFVSFSMISGALAGLETPASDLTITVAEQENGDVKFSLRGTAYYKQAMGTPYRTPVDGSEVTPPHTLDMYVYEEIPPGLILTVPDNTPSVLPNPTREVPLLYLDFNSSGYWSFYSFSTGTLNNGDELVGSGMVVTDEVPFSHFEVGTFVVEGQEFDATYVVIPFDPQVKVPAMRSFPKTRLGTSSRNSNIVIRNTGASPVKRLRVRIKGRAKRDFRIRKRPATTIEPGKSTTLKVYFRPRRIGKRRAIATFTSNAPTEKTKLKGKGFLPLPPPRLNRP